MIDQVVAGKYNRIQFIGQGNCGRVFLAQSTESGNYLALKVDTSENRALLHNEKNILAILKGVKGVPRLIDFGDLEEYSFLAMVLLGQSLEDRFIESQRKFPFEDFSVYSKQILGILEGIHGRDVIHRDLKPRQILFGPASKNDELFIVDFGISMKYKDGSHINYKEHCGFVGTSNYCSLYTHRGIQQSRRDDLESYCYLLAYFFTGTLPWFSNSVHNSEQIAGVKEKVTGKELFGRGAKDLIDIFKYVKQLKFEDEIDYEYIRNKLKRLESKFTGGHLQQYSLMPLSKPKKVKKKFTFIEDTEDVILNLDSTIVTKGPEINREILKGKFTYSN